MTDDTVKGERLRKGLTLAQRRGERREALLEAALDLFGTQGYAATTVEELCRTAYVSTRNFYEEFDNREAVLFALGDRLVFEARQAMVEVEVPEGPDRFRRGARARVGALMHALLDDPRRARLAFIESVGVSPVQEARRREAHRMFAEYFAGLVKPGADPASFGTTDSDLYALALVGSINEVLSDWVLRPDKPPVDDLIEPIVDIVEVLSAGLRRAGAEPSGRRHRLTASPSRPHRDRSGPPCAAGTRIGVGTRVRGRRRRRPSRGPRHADRAQTRHAQEPSRRPVLRGGVVSATRSSLQARGQPVPTRTPAPSRPDTATTDRGNGKESFE